jgi:hypothetical protein
MSPRGKRNVAVSAGLPGITTFDIEPLAIAHDGPVRRIRLSLKGRQYLHLNGLTISSAEPIAPERVSASMSSALEKKGGEPLDLLNGKPIHTRKDPAPFWEAVFADPVAIRGIEIRNRQGWRASRASGIIVEFEDEAGAVTVFDNLSEEVIGRRLAEARRAGQELAGIARGKAAGVEEFGLAWAGLLDLTERAVAGEEVMPEDLAAARLRAVEAILAVLEQLDGDDLARALPVAGGLMVLLIERGSAARRALADPIGTRALAVYVTGLLVRRASRKVTNLELFTFRHLYDKQEQIPPFEEEISSLYLRATGDTNALPFMVRVHGISGPQLQLRADDYLSGMQDVQEGLEQLGYGSMICYGTLLGAVRDGRFIDHDDDVDMAVSLKTADAAQEMKDLAAALKGLGFRCRIIRASGLIHLTNPKRRVSMDLFPIIPTDEEHVSMFMEGMRIRPVARSLIFPLGTISFLGHVFGAPAQPEGFLADRYGPDWQTPQRKIGHKVAKG